MSMRRQSRVSSHASLPEHKSEAASNERSTRSRTSSEDLVVLELPKIVRTKRSGHQRSGVEVQHDPVKNGKAGLEGEVSRRGLRSTEHSVSKNVDASVTVDCQSSGGGDAKVLGRTRRRSGRVTNAPEEAEKAETVQQDALEGGRCLRRRTRSGASTDCVDNGPAERPKDNDQDRSRHRSSDGEDHNLHKLLPNKTSVKDVSASDVRKGSGDVSSSHEHHHKSKDLPQSTSVHKASNPLKSKQIGLGETVEQAGPVTVSLTGLHGSSEQPREIRDKVPRLDLPSAPSEGPLSRTSQRRARQSHLENKNNLPNDKQEASESDAGDAHLLASNGVKGGKTSPRKRTRSGSTSVSPRKPAESQEAVSVEPGSPKRRRTGSVCRDLSQDFNTAKLTGTETTPAPSSQAECNNKILADPQDSSGNKDTTPGATVNDGTDKETFNLIPLIPGSTDTRQTEDTLVMDTVLPQRSRRRSGTSPRGTPQKQAQLDLTKSPTRRGLRSGGAIPEAPPEVTQRSEVTDNAQKDREAVTPSISPAVSPRKSSGKKRGSSKKDSTLGKGEAKESGEEPGEQGQEARFSREEVDYQAEEWYEDVDETEPFYFESDHMAIKGSKDYRMLLRTLTTLEAQRKQAIQDLDKLLESRDKALKNPVKFVHKLQHKDTLNLPHSQRIVTCPDIDWGRYIGPPETNELLGLVSQPRSMRPSKSTSNTTHAQAAGCGSSTSTQTKPVPAVSAASQALSTSAGVPVSLDPDMPSTSSTPDTAQNIDMLEPTQEPKLETVRGRVAEANKPPTFNQLWTRDEQRRLEESLVKFPTEEVEARRWEKIAKALGNRTSQQVASRVQKYFIKLMKAGMPVPGRLPNLATYQNCKKTGKKIHPFTKPLYQASTFLQSIQPPVYMADDDPYSYADGQDDDDDDDELVSDDESVPTDVRDTPEYQELIQLKLMKRRKVRQQGHTGFRCDGCDMEPIIGVRWHCTECPEPVSTDLCQNCVNRNFSSKHHSSSHRMEPVHTGYSQSYVDGDYTSFEPSSGDYNYLDPNYNPVHAAT
ncbi:ZZ-type zinc finger-containing protein 3-like isoform X2 [Patiria miniata]|uniref:ZZ-type zinc finger-containing protein 3 n=1 Tax=Patiria miniata TaxID=46514 RepID=A0A913Z616_PATMI|nr:ZZ-type zinc finger-containing protein 3-like isoform X2 [Patiria miniata]